MAKNFIQEGEFMELPAPYDVASGKGALVGSIFGVAITDVLSGQTAAFGVCGVWELAKVSAQAWTVGAKIYWDNTAKLATTVSTSNTLIGAATAAAANPSSTGWVWLTASSV